MSLLVHKVRWTNISFVIEQGSLRKALNVIHDSFFFSDTQVLNVLSPVSVWWGSNLLDQIRIQQPRFAEKSLRINIVGLSNSRQSVFCREGISLDNYEVLKASP